MELVFYLSKVIPSVIICTYDFIKLIAILNKVSNTHKQILISRNPLFAEVNCELRRVLIAIALVRLLVLYDDICIDAYGWERYFVERLTIAVTDV